MVDTRGEADREVAGACAEFQDRARPWSEQRLNDREGLVGIGRPMLVRCRDLLVTELGRVLGREMLWFGLMWLSQDLSM